MNIAVNPKVITKSIGISMLITLRLCSDMISSWAESKDNLFSRLWLNLLWCQGTKKINRSRYNHGEPSYESEGITIRPIALVYYCMLISFFLYAFFCAIINLTYKVSFCIYIPINTRYKCHSHHLPFHKINKSQYGCMPS